MTVSCVEIQQEKVKDVTEAAGENDLDTAVKPRGCYRIYSYISSSITTKRLMK